MNDYDVLKLRNVRAWLDGKIQLDIRDQQEGQNPGRVAEPQAQPKDCIHHVVLKSWDLMYVWERLKQFSQHGDSNLSFFPNVLLCKFSTTYKSRENSP